MNIRKKLNKDGFKEDNFSIEIYKSKNDDAIYYNDKRKQPVKISNPLYPDIRDLFKGLSAQGTTNATTAVLEYGVNVFTTANASNYAAKLPQPKTGRSTIIVNNTNNSIKLFPSNVGGKINNGAVDAPASIPADGKSYTFICIENPNPGEWTWDAPATGQIEFAEIEINHTNGVVTSLAGGYTTANLGNAAAGVDASGNLALSGSWLTEPTKTTVTKMKTYTNMLQTDLLSDNFPDVVYVNLNTAFLTGVSSSTLGSRITSLFRGGGSFTGELSPVGSLSSPPLIGDTNTMYENLMMGSPNGISDQLGLGGAFSRYYYNLGFYIPASAATKVYKFKIFLETFTN